MKSLADKIKSAVYFATELNLWLTLKANLHYVGWRNIFKIPYLVYSGTQIRAWGGAEIHGQMKPGLVTIGGGGIGTLDFKNERTIWDNRGTIVFSGRADFGKGSRISVDERGVLEIGAGFHLSGRSSIICNHRIVLGNDLLLSWDILIMDSDFHPIKPKDSNDVINNPKEIVIGNHVWIGCRSMILKGVTICDNVVLAAGSVITRSIETPDCVVTSTGGPIQVIKEHITWDEQ